MGWTGRIIGALALVASTITVGATPAGAAEDTTPPTIAATPWPAFVVGGIIGESVVPTFQDDYNGFTNNIPILLRWTASDAGGLCGGVDVYRERDETTPLLQAGVTGSTLQTMAGTYDGEIGGSAATTRSFKFVAKDCAGNTSEARTSTKPRVVQETGSWAPSGERPPSTMAYKGSWSTSKCKCWSQEQIRKTTAKNASVTFAVPMQDGGHIAVVMAKGAGRGKAQIKVDGKVVATVDTLASTSINRVIVWEGAVKAGTRTVQVVNLATAGRPRIDIDAFLVNGWAQSA